MKLLSFRQRSASACVSWTSSVVAAMSFLAAGTSGCSDEDRPPLLDRGESPSELPEDRVLPETTDAFHDTGCAGVSIRGYLAQCGEVTVPARPGSDETYRVAVMRVFSEANEPAVDPIVYLEGGPGGHAIANMAPAIEYFEPLLANRDLIVVDQRGTGRSKPELSCSEVDRAKNDDEALSAMAACYDRYVDEGVEPSHFNSALSASDVDAVRRALGYEQWNLYGISYGTRLALTILRDHPEGVRSVVIDSVVPLEADLLADLAINGQRAFEKVFAACAADESCAEEHPGGMEQLRSTAAALNETPVDVGGYEFTGDDLVGLLFNVLYDATAIGFVPALIDQAAAGDLEVFEGVADSVSSGGFSFGMHLSLQCAEEYPFTDLVRFQDSESDVHPELLPALTGSAYADYCERWPVEPAADVENEPVSSNRPTLVIAGGFDPITPPAYAELVHESLANSTYLLLGGESHGASVSDCGFATMVDFLDDPAQASLDTSCALESPQPDFLGRGGRASARGAVVPGRIDFVEGPVTADELRDALDDFTPPRPRPRLRPR